MYLVKITIYIPCKFVKLLDYKGVYEGVLVSP